MPDLLELQPTSVTTLTDEELTHYASQLLALQRTERQQNQLRYYKAASPLAQTIHTSIVKTIGIGGGNGAGKTDHALAEMVIRATGQIPVSLAGLYPMSKLRGPIACRVVCESLTTTLYPIILPKLQWWKWSGVGQPGSEQGHWGWIPKHCLVGGEWQKSWTDKLRMLRLLYRDPTHPERVIGESTIQFMSYDQDPSDFASGDFHFVLHDEPPKYDIWRENRARVMRVDGTLMVSMTWPDNPAIPVDWIFDELYDKAQPGPNKDPSIDWVNIFSTDNPHLNQRAVADRAAQMSETERAVRIYGQPIRFSNRIHPLFTDVDRYWCFDCGRDIITLVENKCCECGSSTATHYTHVQHIEVNEHYPVIFALDPHPRKPHMAIWVQVDPSDDLQQVAEIEVSGGAEALRDAVFKVEDAHGWSSIRRIMDPNMGRSPSGAIRGVTWQDEFARVGLICDLADDGDPGRARFNELLKPDLQSGKPRFLSDPTCTRTHFQLKRYVWDEYRMSSEKDIKQKARTKNDDYPTLLKYVCNLNPRYRGLQNIGTVYSRGMERPVCGY